MLPAAPHCVKCTCSRLGCGLQVLVTQDLKDTVLRCAGGWVRDKLLGKDSKDIDIALNNLYGEQFAAHVNDHLQASSQKLGKVRGGSCMAAPATLQLVHATHLCSPQEAG